LAQDVGRVLWRVAYVDWMRKFEVAPAVWYLAIL